MSAQEMEFNLLAVSQILLLSGLIKTDERLNVHP